MKTDKLIKFGKDMSNKVKGFYVETFPKIKLHELFLHVTVKPARLKQKYVQLTSPMKNHPHAARL